MKARGQPACAGYVQAIDGAKDNPERAVYTVKCLAGPQHFVGKSYPIKRGRVPKGVKTATPIRFDVVWDHESGELVAVNITRHRVSTAQESR